MTSTEETVLVREAVTRAFVDAELGWPPPCRGPIPLDRLIATYGLAHEEVPGLNFASASACLRRWGLDWAEIPDPDEPLAGFLYAGATYGLILVRRGDGLTRRRFTAAHELGHHRLHLQEDPQFDDGGSGRIQADANISEASDPKLSARERQANLFAAELLMPESVCRSLFKTYANRYGVVPRFLVHHLASDLLVSRQAMAWRLKELELIDEPTWLADEPGIGQSRPVPTV